MKNYELTLLVDEKITSAKRTKLESDVSEMVTVQKGKVIKKDSWGVIELAYKINKKDKAHFLFFDIEIEAQGAKQIGLKIKTLSDVFRHLFVVKD